MKTSKNKICINNIKFKEKFIPRLKLQAQGVTHFLIFAQILKKFVIPKSGPYRI